MQIVREVIPVLSKPVTVWEITLKCALSNWLTIMRTWLRLLLKKQLAPVVLRSLHLLLPLKHLLLKQLQPKHLLLKLLQRKPLKLNNSVNAI